jgi:hypothetical protein
MSEIYSQRYFVLKWTFVNLLGWLVAHILGIFILGIFMAILHEGLSYDIRRPETNRILDEVFPYLTVLISAISMGILALLQWRTLLKKILPNRRFWIACNVVSGITIGLILANLLFEHSSPLFDDFLVGLVALSFSLAIASALPQWFALHRHVELGVLWLLANVIGAMVAALLLLLSAASNTVEALAFGYCFGAPLIFGAITGLVLFNLLKYGKRVSE